MPVIRDVFHELVKFIQVEKLAIEKHVNLILMQITNCIVKIKNLFWHLANFAMKLFASINTEKNYHLTYWT